MRRRVLSSRLARLGSDADIPALILLIGLLATGGLQGCTDVDDAPARGGAEKVDRLSERSLPVRIVSLSPLATRFLLALEIEDRVVGADPESARLLGLARSAVVDLESAGTRSPDLLLLPDLGGLSDEDAARLDSIDAPWFEFAPHDLEDVTALSRRLGGRLVGPTAAALFERNLNRPLALIGGQSPPRDRLRVLPLVDVSPLTLAGGHSFETDLIEIGGGSSVTHGGEDSLIAIEPTQWADFQPDLVVLMTRDVLSPEDRRAIRALVPDRYALEFFDFDRELFWLGDPTEEAERMRQLIAGAARR